MSSSPCQIIGLVGVLAYMLPYVALQVGLIRGDGLVYTLSNLVAASLVLVSLTDAFNLPSALIQTTWIAVSLVGLARIARQRRREDGAAIAAA